jgi:hypothetical protein
MVLWDCGANLKMKENLIEVQLTNDYDFSIFQAAWLFYYDSDCDMKKYNYSLSWDNSGAIPMDDNEFNQIITIAKLLKKTNAKGLITKIQPIEKPNEHFEQQTVFQFDSTQDAIMFKLLMGDI